MIVSHIHLENWRNFREIDIDLGDRVFLVGPNASGKSNFLDVFRFLRDISTPEGGGLQKAVRYRGGISKIRCLAARAKPDVVIEIELSEGRNTKPLWKYSIGIKQQRSGKHLTILSHEKVWKNGERILERPTSDDEKDVLLLTQTHLENINTNVKFREISSFFSKTLYFHLIPQLLQHPHAFVPALESSEDPYGRNLLRRIGETRKDIRHSRLRKIEKVLKYAVPQLTNLKFVTDESEGGIPHLEVLYEHWRPHGARQREDQFSDGTLRLIALMWSLLESNTIVLFEEPELSLHTGIVNQLSDLMYQLTIKNKVKNQIILSTHSSELLSNRAIGGEEVVMLTPGTEGTTATVASDDKQVKILLESGLTVAETVLPRTAPKNVYQMNLFDE